MSWEIVVGIETHAQLLTHSKIFSGAATAFGAAPKAVAADEKISLAVRSWACVSMPTTTSQVIGYLVSPRNRRQPPRRSMSSGSR